MYANHAPQFIAPHIPQIFHEFVLMFSIMVYCRSRVWFLVLSHFPLVAMGLFSICESVSVSWMSSSVSYFGFHI